MPAPGPPRGLVAKLGTAACMRHIGFTWNLEGKDLPVR